MICDLSIFAKEQKVIPLRLKSRRSGYLVYIKSLLEVDLCSTGAWIMKDTLRVKGSIWELLQKSIN